MGDSNFSGSDLDLPSSSSSSASGAYISPSELLLAWKLWGVIATLVAFFCAAILFSILLSPRKVRTNPYNLYLTYLTAPDAFYSVLCAVACFLNVSAGEYYSEAQCRAQSWGHVFGISSNAWLNAVVAGQIRGLLRDCRDRRRYRPPSARKVTGHAAAVYAYGAFLASWIFLRGDGGPGEGQTIPNEASSVGGMVCFPVGYDGPSTLFFWLVFFPALFAAPLTYVLYVCFDVWRNRLLPRSGRTRSLAMYFFRIAAVFVLIWIPAFVLLFAIRAPPTAWIGWVGGTLTHVQAVVSGAFALTKPDIRKAMLDLVRCERCRQARGGAEVDVEGTAPCTEDPGVTDAGSSERPAAPIEGRESYRLRSILWPLSYSSRNFSVTLDITQGTENIDTEVENPQVEVVSLPPQGQSQDGEDFSDEFWCDDQAIGLQDHLVGEEGIDRPRDSLAKRQGESQDALLLSAASTSDAPLDALDEEENGALEVGEVTKRGTSQTSCGWTTPNDDVAVSTTAS